MRNIKRAVLVNVWAPTLALVMIGLTTFPAPQTASAYKVYVQAGSDEDTGACLLRVCWDFTDPLGKKQHICSWVVTVG